MNAENGVDLNGKASNSDSVDQDSLKETRYQFRFVESITPDIEKVLERRLPFSANVFNMTKVYDNFEKPNEMAFYVMDTSENGSDAGIVDEEHYWILGRYFREDYGMRHTISAPLNPVITEEIRMAFIKCPYINWDESYHFGCISFNISQLIWEISTKVFGNSVSSMPCATYVIDRDDAVRMSLDASAQLTGNLLLKPMDTVKGSEFVSSTWKYSVGERTIQALRKLIMRNKSVGLYDQSGIGTGSGPREDKEGKIICGMLINDCGLMGMLHTLPEHRGKGYASLVARKLIKSFAEEDGAVPCSAVEMRNYKSIAFHEKLGMRFSHYSDFIRYTRQTWD